MARRTQMQYKYTARDGTMVSKKFKNEETAMKWFERVGATDIVFRYIVVWDEAHRWWAPEA